MTPSASIQLKNLSLDIRLEWFDYDDDDCFNNFQIMVFEDGQKQKFDFGACSIAALRKLIRFFTDSTQETAGLGFRNPDICYCDFFRDGTNYRLIIRFEGNNFHKEFALYQPTILINDDFLKSY